MARKEPIPDSVLKNKVTQQLANRGLRTPCRINVDVRKGILTMTGHVQYPHQRDAAMAAVRSVDGLMRVVEQIQIRPPAKHQYKTLPPLPKKTEGEAEAAVAEQTADASAAETPAAEAPQAAAAAQAVAEDDSSTTAFDLGPVKAPVAEGESASASPSPTANGAAKVDAAEEDSSEMDFELGPAALSA
ncbi:MAG TPA: BON domain-containing protein, partial [Pirellulales bacterium]|nr:BON domain-containing protein [Pirellulales bacterium]